MSATHACRREAGSNGNAWTGNRPAATLPAIAASLVVEGVSWRANADTEILAPLSFTLEPGTILAIVGPNGSGKSTLLRTIYRHHRPTTGRIMIDGRDTSLMKRRDLARKVAVVLQEQPADFSLSVRDIVGLGRAPHRTGFSLASPVDSRIVNRVITDLGLEALANRKLDTLSGGERQRVMLARALVQEPGILILDEPTNHLDIRHQLELLAMLRHLRITVICSLHDLNAAAEVADRVMMLAGGRMLAFGTAGEVMSETHISDAFSVGVNCLPRGPKGGNFYTFHI